MKLTKAERHIIPHAKRKFKAVMKSLGYKMYGDGIKEWVFIYEFMQLCGINLLSPTKNQCIRWLLDEYIKQEIPYLLKNEKSTPFYGLSPWRQLRIKVFNHYGYVCMRCKSTEFLVVDHIKPRSLHPELELEFDNMQVLCNSCNLKKSNKHSKDYRPNFYTDITDC